MTIFDSIPSNMANNWREKYPGLLNDMLPTVKNERQKIINNDIATPAQRERLRLEVDKLKDEIVNYFNSFGIDIDISQILGVDDIVFTPKPDGEYRDGIFHPALSLITIYVNPEEVDIWLPIVLHELVHSASRISAYVLPGNNNGINIVGKSGLSVSHVYAGDERCHYFAALNEAITAMIEESILKGMTNDGSYLQERRLLLLMINTMSEALHVDKRDIYREFLYSYVNGFSSQLKKWLLEVYNTGIMKVLAYLQEFSNYNFSDEKTTNIFTKLIEYIKGTADINMEEVVEWLIARSADNHTGK